MVVSRESQGLLPLVNAADIGSSFSTLLPWRLPFFFFLFISFLLSLFLGEKFRILACHPGLKSPSRVSNDLRSADSRNRIACSPLTHNTPCDEKKQKKDWSMLLPTPQKTPRIDHFTVLFSDFLDECSYAFCWDCSNFWSLPHTFDEKKPPQAILTEHQNLVDGSVETFS